MDIYKLELPEDYEKKAEEIGIDLENASSEDIFRFYAKLMETERIGTIIEDVCKGCKRKSLSIDIMLGGEYEA